MLCHPENADKEVETMIKVYCYSKCTTCQNALRWLDEQAVRYTLLDIKTEHPDEAALRKYHALSGLPLKRFFNTSGIPYRELELSKKLPALSEDEQFALLASNGMLVKRPLLVGDDFVLAGFREDEWREKLLPDPGAVGTEKKPVPSVDRWLREAKEDPSAAECGMYLIHNGTVRQTARARVRQGDENTDAVTGMNFRYDAEKVDLAIQNTRKMAGIFYVRVWLNEGLLSLGDDIMLVLVGGDIRPHVIDALQALVGTIKKECVIEQELF